MIVKMRQARFFLLGTLALWICLGFVASISDAAAISGVSAPSSTHAPIVKLAAYRPERVARILTEQGYRQIEFVDKVLPIYIVTACKNKRKVRLRLNRFGTIRQSRVIGRCGRTPTEPKLEPSEVRRILTDLGYRRITFIDRQLPLYVIEACHKRSAYLIRVDQRGDIAFRERLGRCGARRRQQQIAETLKPREVRRRLRARGFNRVQFIDRQLPTYIVLVCKNEQRFRLRIDGQGRIRRRAEIGECRTPREESGYDLAYIENLLKSRRYYDIRFVDNRPPNYTAEACRLARKYRLRLNTWGDIRGRTAIDRCDPPSREALIRPVDESLDFEQIKKVDRLDPDDCQDYLEILLNKRTINFDTNSATIKRASYPLLDQLAFIASRCPRTAIEIAGHTDARGSDKANQTLSERRATSVTNYLANTGVARSRVSAVGYGEKYPIASNGSKAGRARNRRIEFVLNWSQ